MNNFISYITTNKLKLSIASLFTFSSIYFIAKHSRSLSSFISFLNNFNEDHKQQILLSNELLYINTTQNTNKLNSYIINSLNTYLKINETKLLLQKQSSSSSINEKISNWEILKEKVFTAFYASTYLLKFYHLIEITHVALLQKYCEKEHIKQETVDRILNELWEISNKVLEKLVINIKNEVQVLIEKVKINQQLSIGKWKELLMGIHDKVFKSNESISLRIFEPFYDEVNILIEDDYQKKEFIYNDKEQKNEEIYRSIMMYNCYYDVISSQLFGNVLYEICNCDIIWKVEMLLMKVCNGNINGNDIKITLPKIITALDEIIYTNIDIGNSNINVFSNNNIISNNKNNENVIQIQKKINLITKEYFLSLKTFPL